MCTFCEPDDTTGLTAELVRDKTLSVSVENAWDGRWYLMYRDRVGTLPVRITHCPKCGRKLESDAE